MTVCIGVIDKQNKCCYVGADRGVCNGKEILCSITPKVFHPYGRNDIIIACSGSIRMGNLLSTDETLFESIPEDSILDDATINIFIKTVIPKIANHYDTLSYSSIRKGDDPESFNLIIAIQDRLYRVLGDLSVYESESGIMTIGCGKEVAYGAMKAFEQKEPRINYVSKIIKSIQICSEYTGYITSASIVLCTREL